MPHFGRPNHGTYLIELRNIMMEVAKLRRFGAAALEFSLCRRRKNRWFLGR